MTRTTHIVQSRHTVTFDTNSVDDSSLIAAAIDAGFDVAYTSVTEREFDGTTFRPAIAASSQIMEAAVIGESRIGSCVIASDQEEGRLERLVEIISNASFQLGQAEGRSAGHARQLRDAMILSAHIREGRSIFVTNDVKGFIAGGRRELIEKEFGSKIMTGAEFRQFCQFSK